MKGGHCRGQFPENRGDQPFDGQHFGWKITFLVWVRLVVSTLPTD